MTQQTEFFRDSLADGHVEYVRPGLARRYDPATSHEAAAKVSKRLSESQAMVLAAFDGGVEMNGGECEKLPQFATWKPSSVRHRISDLAALTSGKLVECGKRDGMTVYKQNKEVI